MWKKIGQLKSYKTTSLSVKYENIDKINHNQEYIIVTCGIKYE